LYPSRWTDSPDHDPYAATNGLWWAHCGWIFRKPIYPRMKLIERADLEADPGESTHPLRKGKAVQAR
jgi:fatty-acid desaturase